MGGEVGFTGVVVVVVYMYVAMDMEWVFLNWVGRVMVCCFDGNI